MVFIYINSCAKIVYWMNKGKGEQGEGTPWWICAFKILKRKNLPALLKISISSKQSQACVSIKVFFFFFTHFSILCNISIIFLLLLYNLPQYLPQPFIFSFLILFSINCSFPCFYCFPSLMGFLEGLGEGQDTVCVIESTYFTPVR